MRSTMTSRCSSPMPEMTVCPEEAIVSGDLHDQGSAIARLAALPGAVSYNFV